MAVDKAMVCAALPLVIEGLESLSDLPFFQGWAPRALRVLSLADKLYCGGQNVFGIDEVLDEDELEAAKMLAAKLAEACPCDDCECEE